MRTFIAINFDEATVDSMVSVQDKLASCGRGNFTRRENLHLTLAFLGEISIDDVAVVKRAMNSIDVTDMELTFSRVGCFRGESELWWIGIDNNPALIQLQRSLVAAIDRAGISSDKKKFKPHITLARQMNIGKRDIHFKPFTARVDSISLMLSERIDGKLTYTEI